MQRVFIHLMQSESLQQQNVMYGLSPDRICIQPHKWNTVVDLRNIIRTKHNIVNNDVATAIPANIVAIYGREKYVNSAPTQGE
jgi:hypothetical protein